MAYSDEFSDFITGKHISEPLKILRSRRKMAYSDEVSDFITGKHFSEPKILRNHYIYDTEIIFKLVKVHVYKSSMQPRNKNIKKS